MLDVFKVIEYIFYRRHFLHGGSKDFWILKRWPKHKIISCTAYCYFIFTIWCVFMWIYQKNIDWLQTTFLNTNISQENKTHHRFLKSSATWNSSTRCLWITVPTSEHRWVHIWFRSDASLCALHLQKPQGWPPFHCVQCWLLNINN